jgi:tripartite-type tricarboxylate transporter receptor subunit TctC
MKVTARLFAALLALLAVQTASAQSGYPNRPVKILVGFTPGTAPDLAARILADRFSEVWGTPFVVEDLPGAGSNVATERVAKAAADGYTLLMGGNPALVINPSLYETLPFDPLKDFAPISQVFIAANVLAVPPELPVKTVAELVALAKAQPGKLSYGHAGVGTSQHLGAELFKYMAHVDIAPVPYRGTTALIPDLLANRINMSFANIVNVVPLAREGKLRALAITSIKRSALAPDLPTMAESGFPGFEAVPWFGLLAPAGTPKDDLDKLHDETVKALAMPAVHRKFDELGLEPVGNTPAEFIAIIKKRPSGQKSSRMPASSSATSSAFQSVLKRSGDRFAKETRPNTLEDFRRVAICRAARSRTKRIFQERLLPAQSRTFGKWVKSARMPTCHCVPARRLRTQQQAGAKRGRGWSYRTPRISRTIISRLPSRDRPPGPISMSVRGIRSPTTCRSGSMSAAGRALSSSRSLNLRRCTSGCVHATLRFVAWSGVNAAKSTSMWLNVCMGSRRRWKTLRKRQKPSASTIRPFACP